VPERDWRRYAAPFGFLLAVTLAVVLIRAGLEQGSGRSSRGPATVPTIPRKHVSTTTTTGKKPKQRAVAQYYTVQAGDTFGVISSKTGVSLTTLQKLNPNASSTSLFIGQRIRIR